MMEAKFEGLPTTKDKSQFTTEGYDKINEALAAFEAYNKASTEAEKTAALAAATAAVSELPGALYRNAEEFDKDFFSDSPIIL